MYSVSLGDGAAEMPRSASVFLGSILRAIIYSRILVQCLTLDDGKVDAR